MAQAAGVAAVALGGWLAVAAPEDVRHNRGIEIGAVLGESTVARPSKQPLEAVADAEVLQRIVQAIPLSFEGRLFGLLNEQQSAPGSGLAPASEETAVSRAAAVVAASRQSASPLSRSGLAAEDIIRGRSSRAIARLEELLLEAPSSAHVHNDLAVAYLQRYTSGGGALDLLAALRHVSKALATDPGAPEPLFNFALVSDRIGLRRAALEAANRVMRGEPASEWSRKAAAIAERSSDESYLRDWERLNDGIEAGKWPDRRELLALVGGDPHRGWMMISENLLGLWAGAVLSANPDQGARALAEAEAAAAAVAQAGSDRLALDTVAAIRTAAPNAIYPLAAAHAELAAGMRAYRSQDFARAEGRLAKAELVFRKAKSIAGDEAAFYRAICMYYGNVPAAQRRFEELREKVDASRYPDLAARTLWMLGTTQMVQLRFEEAIQSFTDMRALVNPAGGPVAMAMASTLLGEAYELRGEGLKGWTYRFEGLSQLASTGDYRRRHAILLEAAAALLRRGDADLSLLFLDELETNDKGWPEPVGRAELYSLRAEARLAVGDSDHAQRDASLAVESARAMARGSLRTRSLGSALLAEGAALARSNPREALARLQSGYELEHTGKWETERLGYLHSRAEAELALGDPSRARETLEEAVAAYEVIRREAKGTGAREEAFRLAQPSFDELVRIALAGAGGDRNTSSLMYSERARARSLVDAWSGETASEPWRDLTTTIRALPSAVSVVAFHVLPEGAVAWSVDSGRVRVHRLSPDRETLTQLCTAFRAALQADDVAGARRSGGLLYEALIRPLGLPIGAGRQLVIVPDGPLVGVPFAALFDHQAHRYLVEALPVATAPSVALYAAAQKRREELSAAGTLSALIVGNPTLLATRWPTLASLPGALAEARDIASLYPHRMLLEQGGATSKLVEDQVQSFRVLHFAGHAVARGGEEGSSALLVAPDGAGDAGEVSIEKLRMPNTELAVLAACRSLGSEGTGREAPQSIATAFFSAGVPSVVATLWDVDDARTRALMGDFHRGYVLSRSAPRALRDAMLKVIHSAASESSSSWTAFAVFGS